MILLAFTLCGAAFPTINPSTGEKICDVQEGDKETLDYALHEHEVPDVVWFRSSKEYSHTVIILDSPINLFCSVEILNVMREFQRNYRPLCIYHLLLLACQPLSLGNCQPLLVFKGIVTRRKISS